MFQVSVLSYNIHKGFTPGRRQLVLSEIRQLLRQTEVDLVFLQEVLGEHQSHSQTVENWPDVSQYEFLADQIWQDHSYGRNSVYEGGHHGNAILSRFPITHFLNIDISTNRLERRGLLQTEIKAKGRKIYACCTHLDLTARGRRKQVAQLCSHLNQVVPDSAPLILAGDFNDWSKRISSPFEKQLDLVEVIESTHGRLKPTFPARLPMLSLDRIYVRGFKVIEAQTLKERVWRKLSDHIPVRAVLELAE